MVSRTELRCGERPLRHQSHGLSVSISRVILRSTSSCVMGGAAAGRTVVSVSSSRSQVFVWGDLLNLRLKIKEGVTDVVCRFQSGGFTPESRDPLVGAGRHRTDAHHHPGPKSSLTMPKRSRAEAAPFERSSLFDTDDVDDARVEERIEEHMIELVELRGHDKTC